MTEIDIKLLRVDLWLIVTKVAPGINTLIKYHQAQPSHVLLPINIGLNLALILILYIYNIMQ